MNPVCTAAESQAADRALIDEIGVPGVVLMDQAARVVAEVAHALRPVGLVLVVCGPGNNGGDGWAAARWLAAWGRDVVVWPVAPPRTADAQVFANVARRLGVREVEAVPAAVGLIVDALLGTGATRPPEGRFAEAIESMNGSAAPVVAVDVPSGVDADTGIAAGVAVRATATVTFGAWKRGLLAGDGAALSGEVRVADIGLGRPRSRASAPELADVAAVWPRRAVDDHKARSGRLLILAGSESMAGAAALVARGALAAGAGLVTLATPRDALARLGALPPEVMVRVSGMSTLEIPALSWVLGFDAVVAGPGLGGGAPLPAPLADSLAQLWRESAKPVLFDADALLGTGAEHAGPRVLTPHAGEAARLLGGPVVDRFASARALSVRGVALLKGRNTLVDDGEHTWICRPGGTALATGGSGDVLAGVVGALLARGLDAPRAAWAGAWAHGAAGARLREGATASDIAASVREVLAEIL